MARTQSSRERSPVGPRTPVIVGVGQFTERLDDPGLSRHVLGRPRHRGRTEPRCEDTDADVAAVAAGNRHHRRYPGNSRSSGRTPKPPLGKIRQLPALGGPPDRRRPGSRCAGSPLADKSPQHLITEFAGEIVAGHG